MALIMLATWSATVSMAGCIKRCAGKGSSSSKHVKPHLEHTVMAEEPNACTGFVAASGAVREGESYHWPPSSCHLFNPSVRGKPSSADRSGREPCFLRIARSRLSRVLFPLWNSVWRKSDAARLASELFCASRPLKLSVLSTSLIIARSAGSSSSRLAMEDTTPSFVGAQAW